MLFNSETFLFFFLPILLGLYFLTPNSLKNFTLLVASLVFYAWGGVSITLIILISIVLNYIIGLLIEKKKNTSGAKRMLIIGAVLNLGLVCGFKYLNFFIENINYILESGDYVTLETYSISLPVGISFFTFHGISYITDIYRQKVAAQKNIINHSLYIVLFPQLIAGPIVRYHFISHQLIDRKVSLNSFTEGIERFIIGLAKKTLLANTFALVADKIFDQPMDLLSTSAAWLGAISYTFQIYYDFSAYSDMAIGLGKMFGFELPENFNFPYLANSIQDFWRRWHISLSTWFRDYLYIPLGGNRGSKARTLFNLFIVFLCTGFWHGASWSFIFWGLIHGTFIIIEKAGFDNILNRLWKPLQNLYVLIVVVLAWVFFRIENFDNAFLYIQRMFGLAENNNQWPLLFYFFNNEFILCFLAGICGAFGIFNQINKQTAFLKEIKYASFIHQGVAVSILMCLLLVSIMYIVTGSYNPFIYFRF